ncbi:MAG: iron-siderophore ABC transporter substrate-binding protein [Actinomycetota bacterium]
MGRASVRVAASAVVGAALTLAACGGGSATSSGTDEGDRGAQESAFPVTIEHKYGSTEIPGEPARVLSLGFQEHDAIFALGVTPIAVRYWFGDKTDVIFPWAEDEAAGATPEILEMPYDNLNFEKIASLEPDLILGIYSGMTDKDYETLSAIAPTVAQTDDYVDYGVPWQDMTRTVGRALGREDRATELVEALEGRFAAIKAEKGAFAGKMVAVATYSGPGSGPGFFASEDPRSRFFTSLGFKVPAALDEIAGDQFFGTVSPERLDVLDTDVLVWDQLQYVEGGPAAIKSDPLVQQLAVMKDGRAVFLEGDLENAFAFNSVLSLPFVLDRLVPMLDGVVA